MTSPSVVGFDPDRLARIGDFVDRVYIQPGRLPCAQVTVMRAGEVAWASTHGMADPARGLALREDAIFRIFSMTKPITSVAFMMLVEEGKVALDDPVSRYIPAWSSLGVMTGGGPGAFTTTKPAAPMRIVDLLRHTSGLSYSLQEGPLADAYREARLADLNGPSLDQTIELLAGLPLAFSPGEAWNYSVSTDVLGYLVGLISGAPFETFLAERIFRPLGMVDTGFHVPAEKLHRFTVCEAIDADGRRKVYDPIEGSVFAAPPSFISGGGGLVSTSADYLRFCRMLLNGGELHGHRLIAPRTLALMTANHLPGGRDLTQTSISLFSESTYAGVGFGLGFAVVMEPERTLLAGSRGEFYWGGMASTAFWIDPVEDLACVFMTQLVPSSTYPVRRQLRTLVYSALAEPHAPRPSRA